MQKAYAKLVSDPTLAREVDSAIERLTALWLRNVYPERKLSWGAYPSLSNHDGCFRCHDGEHKNAAGKAISKDCSICHVVLSENEENPAILETFGMGR
jgi:hypothetical protein